MSPFCVCIAAASSATKSKKELGSKNRRYGPVHEALELIPQVLQLAHTRDTKVSLGSARTREHSALMKHISDDHVVAID